ncbi:GlcG/HbpS family heme-binding protein [Novosphingobium pokkalii]|uniref:Heme-binding protein n=1 Tax=Novosphingobium pokkalii TaxID=1770194 RepID=A0ABV7V0F0_9SPHN|nr:heme-binding protein [Novosphingobium pokkalii]
MTALNLAAAQAVIEATLASARARAARPLAVIVVDAGGHPLAFAREDGASFARLDIARAKASGALAMDADTRVLAQRAAGNPVFFQSVTVALGGQIAFSPGGVLVRDAQGLVLGAVGASGDTGDCDEECVLAGLRAAGFNQEMVP